MVVIAVIALVVVVAIVVAELFVFLCHYAISLCTAICRHPLIVADADTGKIGLKTAPALWSYKNRVPWWNIAGSASRTRGSALPCDEAPKPSALAYKI